MANKYEILALAPIFIFGVFMIIHIQYKMFTTSIIGAIISNFILAWLLFFMYKANKLDALVSNDEVNDGE